MKRLDLIRHLEQHGCAFLREGAKHSVYVNRAKRKSSTVPRHREIGAAHPLMAAITWTEEAQRWLEDIFEYIAADNLHVATTTV